MTAAGTAAAARPRPADSRGWRGAAPERGWCRGGRPGAADGGRVAEAAAGGRLAATAARRRRRRTLRADSGRRSAGAARRRPRGCGDRPAAADRDGWRGAAARQSRRGDGGVERGHRRAAVAAVGRRGQRSLRHWLPATGLGVRRGRGRGLRHGPFLRYHLTGHSRSCLSAEASLPADVYRGCERGPDGNRGHRRAAALRPPQTVSSARKPMSPSPARPSRKPVRAAPRPR